MTKETIGAVTFGGAFLLAGWAVAVYAAVAGAPIPHLRAAAVVSGIWLAVLAWAVIAGKGGRS